MNLSFRNAGPDQLADALQDARNYTRALFDRFAAAGLDDAGKVPHLRTLNPPLWEIGHVAWFAEWYLLRGAQSSAPDAAQRPSLLPHADRWFDSNAVAHDTRWALDLPPNCSTMFETDSTFADVSRRNSHWFASTQPTRSQLPLGETASEPKAPGAE